MSKRLSDGVPNGKKHSHQETLELGKGPKNRHNYRSTTHKNVNYKRDTYKRVE